jgi:aminoglycoside phosphotransferase (APT) family kinase protein
MTVTETRIDLNSLARQVRDRYGLPVEHLTVAAPGSRALGMAADQRYFVRAEPDADLETALAVPAALREEGGIAQVVAPYRTRSGGLTFTYGAYAVAVFPFVRGRAAEPADAEAAAALLARIHRSRLFLPRLRRVTLGHRLAQSVRRLLRAAGRPEGVYAAEARRLLREERGSIEAALATLRRLNAEARALPLRWAVTHGAPSLDNFLVDGRGGLHLIDWGAAALAPVERDLWRLNGPGFAAAARRYAEETGWGRDLRPQALTLYEHRGWLCEIVRSAGTLLNGRGDGRQEGLAWAALNRCLPRSPGDLRARCQAMAEALAAL